MGHPVTKRQVLYIGLILLSLVAMLIISFVDLYPQHTVLVNELSEGIHIRGFGALVFILLLLLMGYPLMKFRKIPWKLFLYVVLPGIVIAINNFPIVAYFDGRAVLDQSGYVIWLFVLYCLAIGLFEEVVFRGLILTVLLQRLPETKNGILLAIVSSSVVFGIIHLVNLLAGAGPMETALQVGYSFLMGMLWAVVYLKTKNLWMSALLHALYNISGLFFVMLGRVYSRYDIVTIVVTVLIGVVATYYYFKIYQSIDSEDIKELYTPEAR